MTAGSHRSVDWSRVVILAVTLLLPSCREHPAGEPEVERLIPLKFGLRPHIAYVPLKIADEEGFFQDEGLDVDLVDVWPQDALVTLPTGRIDAAGVPVFVGLFNAMSRGAPIRIVADKGHAGGSCSPYTLVARSALFVDGSLTVGRIRGLRLERREGSIYDFVMEQFFAANRLSWDDFRQIEWIAPQSAIAAFETDQLDLKIEAEPNQTILAERDIARPWIPVDEIVPGLQFSVIVFGPRLIEREPETGVRFMRAYLRGVRRYNEGPTERNVDIAARFTGIHHGLARKVCWGPIHDDGRVNIEQVQLFVDWIRDQGLLDREMQETDWWDPRFVASAGAGGANER